MQENFHRPGGISGAGSGGAAKCPMLQFDKTPAATVSESTSIRFPFSAQRRAERIVGVAGWSRAFLDIGPPRRGMSGSIRSDKTC